MTTRTKGPSCEDCAIFHEVNRDSTHICDHCKLATCDNHFKAGECPGCGIDPEEDPGPRCQGCGVKWDEAWGTHCPVCER